MFRRLKWLSASKERIWPRFIFESRTLPEKNLQSEVIMLRYYLESAFIDPTFTANEENLKFSFLYLLHNIYFYIARN